MKFWSKWHSTSQGDPKPAFTFQKKPQKQTNKNPNNKFYGQKISFYINSGHELSFLT